MMNALLPARTVFFGRGEDVDLPSSPTAEDQALPSAEYVADQPDLGLDFTESDRASDVNEPTVVQLDEDAHESSPAAPIAPMAPMAPIEPEVPASAPRKRGRPSLSASASVSRNGTPARSTASSAKTLGTAAKAKTPKPADASARKADAPVAASGRKRKAADAVNDEKPAKRPARGRPPASRPISARKAAAEAKKNFVPVRQTAAVKSKPATKGRRGRPPKEEAEDGETWEVEAILDSGIDDDSSEHMYFVKWKGYSDKENTWEPKKNLKGCAELIKNFEASNKTTRKPRQKKTE